MDDGEARVRLLDAAEELYYARGVQAVGMDEIRARSGVPLKRLYRVFPAKADLVAAYLSRRDTRWTDGVRGAVDAAATPTARLGALFDWLAEWFAEPDFRGCAFVNAFGELGYAADPIVEIVRHHKAQLRALLGELADELAAEPAGEAVYGPAGEPADRCERSAELADQLMLLVEGATVVAALHPGPEPARRAQRAAELLASRA